MKKLVVDSTLCAKLSDVDELELCDAAGRPIGHFLSPPLYRRLLYDRANSQISDEELQRRLREPGGRTLAKIWRRMRATS